MPGRFIGALIRNSRIHQYGGVEVCRVHTFDADIGVGNIDFRLDEFCHVFDSEGERFHRFRDNDRGLAEGRRDVDGIVGKVGRRLMPVQLKAREEKPELRPLSAVVNDGAIRQRMVSQTSSRPWFSSKAIFSPR